MRLYFWDMQLEYKKLIKWDEKYYLPAIASIEPMLIEKFNDHFNHQKREMNINKHAMRT